MQVALGATPRSWARRTLESATLRCYTLGVKRIVSVSLGSARRDLREKLLLLGREVELWRRGTDGDVALAGRLIRELDGQVDAIGLGGMDLYVYVGRRRYTLRQPAQLAAQAARTPVVCGAGLKGSLERRVVGELERRLGLRGRRVLVVSAVDRFGMASALAETGAEVRYGDLAFVLGVPYLVRGPLLVRSLARVMLPLVLQAPIHWLYPTGSTQEQAAEPAAFFRDAYAWAEVIAGDWHLIRRYLPACLDGKTVLTNTTTAEDTELLRSRGARWLVTTTPRLNGRSLSTNVLEAAFVAVTGEKLLSPTELAGYVAESGLKGTFLEL